MGCEIFSRDGMLNCSWSHKRYTRQCNDVIHCSKTEMNRCFECKIPQRVTRSPEISSPRHNLVLQDLKICPTMSNDTAIPTHIKQEGMHHTSISIWSAVQSYRNSSRTDFLEEKKRILWRRVGRLLLAAHWIFQRTVIESFNACNKASDSKIHAIILWHSKVQRTSCHILRQSATHLRSNQGDCLKRTHNWILPRMRAVWFHRIWTHTSKVGNSQNSSWNSHTVSRDERRIRRPFRKLN